MANKVNAAAPIGFPFNLTTFMAISDWATQLVNTLTSELRDHALRLNTALMGDGSEAASAPIVFKSYVKAALPSASKYINGLIIVSDDVGGLTPAFSDGTNWRRTADRNIIA